jgi:phospholipase C
MKNFKLTSALLSSAALIAAVAITSNRPVAAQGFLTEIAPIFNLIDQLIGDVQTPSPVNALPTRTPIKHLVVIFQENRSFDHYFGTYPKALNPQGEPAFNAAANTPIPNNYISHPTLLTANPNFTNSGASPTGNGANAANPFRLDRTQANTASENHNYTPEQLAFDHGKLDLFPLEVGSDAIKGTTNTTAAPPLGSPAFNTLGQTMGYFDGNTVTAFWNYAQDFAMSDNFWGDTFGPSTPGAIEMFSGQTNGVVPLSATNGVVTRYAGDTSKVLADGTGNTTNGFTQIGDEDPTLDVCSPAVQPFPGAGAANAAGAGTGVTTMLTGKNIGDLLNARNIPWGSFIGGFNLQTVNAPTSTTPATTGCAGVTQAADGTIAFNPANVGRTSQGVSGLPPQVDYVQHHIWFQYYQSTANPNHLRPTSVAAIGHTFVPKTKTVDPANHAYDLADFTTAVQAGNFPAVSLLKLSKFQDSHPADSTPLDEQTAVVDLINFLQQQPDWSSTAVIIAYDDSDGWYDHAFIAPTDRGSFNATADQLDGAGMCGLPGVAKQPTGVNGAGVNGRCGPGMRLPFLLISPYAKKNYISHVFITQASIPQFIEDNWLNGERIGGGSFDASTGSIMDLFNFDQIVAVGLERKLVLDPTMGTVTGKSH